jgi:hypothetical protein
MQAQVGSFFVTNGQIVVVIDESTMVPIPAQLRDSAPLVIRPE